MDEGIRISAAAMVNRARQQEIIAQNIANINTDYYKAREIFYTNTDGITPEGNEIVNLESGVVNSSGKKLDITLKSNCFLKAMKEDGNVCYIRDGRLSVNDKGELVYKGYRLLDDKGRVIIINNPYELIILGNGDIVQDGKITNKIGIFEIDKDTMVRQNVDGTYIIDDPRLKTATGFDCIMQSFRESSNVDRVKEIINMIKTFHAYEASQKSILVNDEALSKTIIELGKF